MMITSLNVYINNIIFDTNNNTNNSLPSGIITFDLTSSIILNVPLLLKRSNLLHSDFIIIIMR